MILQPNDYVGIISLSNGLQESSSNQLLAFKDTLLAFGVNTLEASTIYRKASIWSGSAKERAMELHKLYLDSSVKVIFDVSGGDVSNEVLSFLDYELIKANPKIFVGYSDLSVIINALYSKTAIEGILYRPFNLVGDYSKEQQLNFEDSFFKNGYSLLKFDYEFIQGNSMSGVVIGGNLRCTLKLAGTSYMPDFKDKILLIESLGGDAAKISTYLTQFKNIGAFDKIKGILLGTFVEMEKNNITPTVEEILINIVDNPNLPIAKTKEIGHYHNSKAVVIGSEYSF